MKRLIAFFVLLVTPICAAVPAETVDGYVACRSEQWLDDFMDFIAAKDEESAQTYLDKEICAFPLKGGLRVTINDVGLAVHGFMFQGTQFYAPREALRVLK